VILLGSRRVIIKGKLQETQSHFQQEVDREFKRIRELLAEAEKSGLVDIELLMRFKGYERIIATIFYWMPEHEGLLQEFHWNNVDCKPLYPRLHAFLDYWQRELDGKIHGVQVGGEDSATKPWRAADHVANLI
jgi:uncharacterized protein Usg